MQSIGQMLGAQALVTGSLTSIADLRRVMFKVLMTETAAVTVQHPADIINDRRVQALLAQGGGSQGLTYSGQGSTTPPPAPPPAAADGGQTPPPAPTPAPSPATPTPAFRIGDVGPAGGIVFYDKGNNRDGWRYMEAAPASTERQIPFFPATRVPDVSGRWTPMRSRLVGDGKKNTELVFEHFVNNGGGFNTAVRYCMDLEVNGFDDWFLPSLDELNWIYGNLFLQDLGSFRRDWYYSSTLSENSYDFVYAKNFSTGNDETGRYPSTITTVPYVRAARRFQ